MIIAHRTAPGAYSVLTSGTPVRRQVDTTVVILDSTIADPELVDAPRDVVIWDATLVDGELPSHSSPTPIAASSAVSTVKAPGDVIKPPVPEKGGKLMMSLAITAGVLALALVGVLILAFVTGVF